MLSDIFSVQGSISTRVWKFWLRRETGKQQDIDVHFEDSKQEMSFKPIAGRDTSSGHSGNMYTEYIQLFNVIYLINNILI